MTLRLQIGVLMGGSSSEREISFQTGKAVISALQDLGHFVFSIDPISGVKQTIQTLTKKKAQCRLQRTARPLRRRWNYTGPAGTSKNSIYPFPSPGILNSYEQAHC